MFSHLLIPLDGSPVAEAALPAACALADKHQSRLLLVSVVNVPHAAQTFADDAHDLLLDKIRSQVFDDAQTYLKTKAAELAAQGYEVDSELIEGSDVAEKILELSNQRLADTIIMSTHGRSGVSRWVFGSVAEKVLRGATIPILLVRAQMDSS